MPSRIKDDGPLAASKFERGRTGWWEWSEPKRILEWLFWAGHITTATRGRSFERVYDLTERVIPAATLALPTPAEAEAHRGLVERASRRSGVATAGELCDYFRLAMRDAKPAIADLVEEGELVPAIVPGWPAAFLHREARCPRRIAARALLAPFDPLVWERARTERLFGFRYRIEIYTPAEKRQHGYYVLPVLAERAARRPRRSQGRPQRIPPARALRPPRAGCAARDGRGAHGGTGRNGRLARAREGRRPDIVDLKARDDDQWKGECGCFEPPPPPTKTAPAGDPKRGRRA